VPAAANTECNCLFPFFKVKPLNQNKQTKINTCANALQKTGSDKVGSRAALHLNRHPGCYSVITKH
jgi:hypothetical protein